MSTNWQTVGLSSISFANAFEGDVKYWWDSSNGYTKFTKSWRSDDITDSNRSVFESLTKGQRDAILAANDNTRVAAANDVVATASLKHQLRQYELELSGKNDTPLWYNGNWNIDSVNFFAPVNDADEKNNLMNMFLYEGVSFLDEASDANSSGVNPIKDCVVCADNVGAGDSNNKNYNSIVLDHVDLIGDADLEFELTDDLITDTLNNLKYPEDALYDGKGQDFIKIKQWKYQPPAKDLITGAQGTVGIGLKEGLARKTARKQQLGFVRLPVPNQIQDSNNVSWGPDQISNITAAVASAVLPLANAKNIENIITKPIETAKAAFGKDAKGKASKFLTNLKAALQGGNAGAAAQGILGSKMLNMAGFDVSAESILARGQGIIPNNNMELLFNSPALREFQFNWKMSPRSESEAKQVNKIIKFFKAGMAVKKQSNVGSGSGASYFLGTPNIFDVQFLTTGNEQIDGLMRIKECACTGCAVNYTPEGNWSAYEEGQPVSVIMTLKFSELEPIYDIDYLEHKPVKYKKENAIDDLPENAVGY